MVYPTFFNLRLNFGTRSSWPEPQSVPGLVFADCIELFYLQLQKIYSIWFQYWPSVDVCVKTHLLCCQKRVFTMTSEFSWQDSVSLCPSFFSSRSNLSVTSGISWLPTFACQSPIMKKTSFFFGISSRRSCRDHSTSASLASVVER